MAAWSKEVFSKNLQYYMERKGISQKELAEIVGVSAPTLNEWIKSKKYPRIDKIEKLANYFGCLKSDLIEQKENPLAQFSPETVTLVERISKLSPDQMKQALEYIDFISQKK